MGQKQKVDVSRLRHSAPHTPHDGAVYIFSRPHWLTLGKNSSQRVHQGKVRTLPDEQTVIRYMIKNMMAAQDASLVAAARPRGVVDVITSNEKSCCLRQTLGFENPEI